MAIRQYRKTQVKEPEIKQFQDAVEQTFRGLTDITFLNGRLIEDLSLASGDNTIDHKLNREIRGYWLVKTTAAITIYDKQSANTTPTITLVINSSAASTVSLWVF